MPIQQKVRLPQPPNPTFLKIREQSASIEHSSTCLGTFFGFYAVFSKDQMKANWLGIQKFILEERMHCLQVVFDG